MKVSIVFGLTTWLMAGLAYGQAIVPDQPISNLQNGIAPFAAAVRAQQDQRRAAAIQEQHQADDRLYAVKARIAAHDCEGARTLALQGGDVLLAQQAGSLCEPLLPLPTRPPDASAASTMELGPVDDSESPSAPSHSLSTNRSRGALQTEQPQAETPISPPKTF